MRTVHHLTVELIEAGLDESHAQAIAHKVWNVDPDVGELDALTQIVEGRLAEARTLARELDCIRGVIANLPREH